MLPLNEMALIVGLGKSGLSAARALQALGVAFAVTDSRADPPGLAALRAECPNAPLYLGGFDPAACCRINNLNCNPSLVTCQQLSGFW